MNGFGAPSVSQIVHIEAMTAICTIEGYHEKDGRVLHVVVNTKADPNRLATAFFDRRFARKEAGHHEVEN